MENYLIIGGSGYLGAEIARQLKPFGNVFSTYFNAPIPGGVKYDFFDDYVPSIVDNHVISTVIFAANVARSVGDDDSDYNEAVERFVTDFENTSVKLVFVSTDAVFSGEKGSYVESDRTNAKTTYGMNVIVFESFIEHLLNIWAIIRVSYLYGDTETHVDKRIVAAREIVESGDKFERSNNVYKSPVHVRDAAKHIVDIATKRIGGFFHIPGRRMSIYDFYRERFGKLGIPCDLLIPVSSVPDVGVPVDTSLESNRSLRGRSDS